jgi:hypothetical protein
MHLHESGQMLPSGIESCWMVLRAAYRARPDNEQRKKKATVAEGFALRRVASAWN